MKQFVTVCVPTYNKAGYLKESLSSILNQTFKDFALIVVDDASSDNTEEVVKSFTDNRLHYYRNTTCLGLGANWNKCIELGLREEGDFLAIYHDDDIYRNTILERQVKFLQSFPNIGLVHTALYYSDEETGSSVLKQPYTTDCIISLKNLLDNLCKHRIYHITTPSVLARKNAYRKAGNFDLFFKICPDLDLWWRMLEHYDLGYIAEPLITVRIHKQQVSSSDSATRNAIMQKETLEVLERVIQRLKIKNNKFNDKYYLAKIKHYCALEVLRSTGKAVLKSETELFRIGVKRAFELSPTPDVFMIVLILKLLNNAFGRNIIELFIKVRKFTRLRIKINGNTS